MAEKPIGLLRYVCSKNALDCKRVHGIRPPLETAAAGRESVVETLRGIDFGGER